MGFYEDVLRVPVWLLQVCFKGPLKLTALSRLSTVPVWLLETSFKDPRKMTSLGPVGALRTLFKIPVLFYQSDFKDPLKMTALGPAWGSYKDFLSVLMGLFKLHSRTLFNIPVIDP